MSHFSTIKTKIKHKPELIEALELLQYNVVQDVKLENPLDHEHKQWQVDVAIGDDIGFKLGPIINSSSRLGFPELSLRLLIEKKNTTINKISEKMIKLNDKRKLIQNKTFLLLKKKNSIINDEVIFIYEPNINEGIIGIIAAKFVDEYNKPTFILTKSNNVIKCSSRSIRGFDVGNVFLMRLIKD